MNKNKRSILVIVSLIMLMGMFGNIFITYGVDKQTEITTTEYIATISDVEIIDTVRYPYVKIYTNEYATYALGKIDDAITKVSSIRSSLGAYQNRLEHTIKNESNIVENTTASESKIRDTDMASMMVEYSKAAILEQVGQSMLAQANQSAQ